LKIYRWTPHSLWIAGPFGIREPDPENWESASPEEIDLALIPGLAFDPMGGRLGRGKGFYDRLLGNPAFRGIKVGLAWEWQLVDEVPGAAHDIRMDIVIAGENIHDPGSMLDKPGERG
jgi:5-formyltetrahydrofolate cyclo-ligase